GAPLWRGANLRMSLPGRRAPRSTPRIGPPRSSRWPRRHGGRAPRRLPERGERRRDPFPPGRSAGPPRGALGAAREVQPITLLAGSSDEHFSSVPCAHRLRPRGQQHAGGLPPGSDARRPRAQAGKWYTVPVWPLDHEGRRYLVPPRGNTHWARNLRASGECELRDGRRVDRFKAVELSPEDAAPIVKLYVERYRRRYGGFVANEFEHMPDPGD